MLVKKKGEVKVNPNRKKVGSQIILSLEKSTDVSFHCYCDIATRQVCNRENITLVVLPWSNYAHRVTFKLSIHVACELQNIRVVLF